ncbi:MAG: hypothetical protein K2N22_01285 [Clostridia bacterium]|nr:hypothetical protein [Clostridia bacterium]
MQAFKPIGVRKDGVYIVPLLIIVVSVLTAAGVLWGFYAEEFKWENLKTNGVELTAEITGYDYHQASPSAMGDNDSSSGWYYIWECNYGGKRYSGTSGGAYFTSEQAVIERLGETFAITVDPQSGWYVKTTLAEVRAREGKFTQLLTAAAILTALSPFALYLFIYRGICPSVMDAKIARCGHLPVQGEVVKTFGLLFMRVKVRYEFRGVRHEKWARRLFTRRDGRFLKDKKYISVVPYKNTFGVLEERRRAE